MAKFDQNVTLLYSYVQQKYDYEQSIIAKWFWIFYNKYGMVTVTYWILDNYVFLINHESSRHLVHNLSSIQIQILVIPSQRMIEPGAQRTTSLYYH